MKRAYAVLEVKGLDDDARTFSGIASTIAVDLGGDSMDPLGAEFTLPMPILWQHGKGEIKDPVGWITHAEPSKDHIKVRGEFAKPKEDYPQPLRDVLNGAWVKVRDKLVRGLSIGWMPVESVPIKNTFNVLHKKWKWFETSAVSLPMNVEATITSIKSIDEVSLRAASGASQGGAVRLNSSPGVTGNNARKGTEVKTIKEQIEAAEAKRAANVARNSELMQKSADEGRSLDEAEAQEYDGLAAEVKQIDAHLTRLREHQSTLVEKAAPVQGKSQEEGTESRSGQTPSVTWGKSNLPPGVRFTRFAMCQMQAKGNLMQAEILSRRYTDTPEVNLACKAAVAAGTTSDATWASPLVQLQEMQSEFVEFLRPNTLLGRIPNLRKVPFNIKFTRQTAGTTGTFVGEGLPKPLGKMDLELLSLTWAKAATIIVMTEELIRFSNPAAEALARDDLAAGINRYLDLRFIDPAYAGVANVSPASITNGVTPIASLGTTIALITDTVELAIASMITANLNLGGLVWVMNPSTALSLSLKRTTQDIFAFPGIGPNGGTFFGYPVITSNNVALSASPTESFLVLMDPREIMVADDGGVSIDMSTEASLQMDSAPTNPASSTVSLWQSNMVALRAERFINWRKRRDAAVAVITMNVAW